ncbi:MAG: TIGR03769 domain-containing protein [Verrucomicrobiales bacterium]|nr:TIGR03769 domain-containing protein [Verrucomicrobiales bacterium]
MFLFRTDAFGNPEVFFNSVDGIDEADLYPAATGAHAHLVWAFSTAGTYRVAVRAAGVLVANGSRSRSAPAEYVFQVRPAALERGHVDIHLAWNAEAGGTLDLAVRDSARGQRFATNEVLLVAGEAAQLTLPDGTPFGAGGDPLWVLPQSEDPGLPYLGFSTDGVPVGVFNGSLRYQLEVVEGPGDFFLWQAEVGGFAVQMNTTDGIDASDVLELTAGGHSHHNWGFTQPGVYHVLLRAEGVLAGSGTEAGSNLLGLTFELAPLPDPLNFAQWQHRFWPTWVPDSIKGRTADPDGNGLVNAMAYALNLHPLVPVSGGRPEAVLIDVGGALYPGLAFTRVKAAGDIVYEVVADDGLPWNAPTPVDTVVSVADHGATETVTMRDAASLPVGGARFLQLRVRWP